MLQLNPPLPVHVVGYRPIPTGTGLCHFVINDGPEHHLYWTVAMDEGGEVYTVENPHIRFAENWTWGRTKKAEYRLYGQDGQRIVDDWMNREIHRGQFSID